MSRCPECGSKGDCDEFCGDSHSDMRDNILELRDRIEMLESLLKLSLCSMNCDFEDGWEEFGFKEYPSEAEVVEYIKSKIESDT